MINWHLVIRQWRGYFFGGVALVLVVIAFLPLRERVNTTPIALALLLAVLFTAAFYGTYPAFATSISAVILFNFFFIPPYHTFTISDPQNWVALIAFLITSLIAGGLSAREKRRAEEAEIRKKEVERLYLELQQAFEKASQAEALKQSEKLKSAILDAVTHDLRTPLTSMKAAVTTLLAGSSRSTSALMLDEQGRLELLEVINVEVDRLNRLVESVIDMAKIEAGALQPRKRWSSMDEVVSIAVARAEGLTTRHRVKVVLEGNLPAARIDEKAIVEVLYVLLENATKYSPPDTDVILIVEKTGQDQVKISVEDRGSGIPLEWREKVFEKFFRISDSDSGSRSRPAGLGMGLAIARGFVEAHGGTIWIEDPLGGGGTRVSFTIPLREQEVQKV